MAIFRKEPLREPLAELAVYYEQLRDVVAGSAPTPGMAMQYGVDTEQFAREYADVDLQKLAYAVGHFKVTVDQTLKTLKPLAQKPLHRP
ncbi:MAG: hypothetical protein LBI87_09535 [Candidatus Accumulibacter sp.]|jgi:hypothetical protein|nr:hypothetical protein [Accumulibacter sp.]